MCNGVRGAVPGTGAFERSAMSGGGGCCILPNDGCLPSKLKCQASLAATAATSRTSETQRLSCLGGRASFPTRSSPKLRASRKGGEGLKSRVGPLHLFSGVLSVCYMISEDLQNYL